MHDVVAPPVSQEVPEYSEAEDERRADAPAAPDVQLQSRPHRHHTDAPNTRIDASFPLPEGQIRHLVPLFGEPLRKVPVPALSPADRVGIETVVDEADAHRQRAYRPRAIHPERTR